MSAVAPAGGRRAMDSRAREHTLRLLNEARAAHDRADTKALGLLAVVSTAFAVVGAAVLAGDWTPAVLPAAGQVLWWAGCVAALAGVGLLAAVVVPARPAPAPGAGGVGYFGDVVALAARDRDPGALAAVLAGALCVDAAFEFGVLAGQLAACARIAVRKYRLIRAGVAALAGAGVLLAAAATLAGAR